MAHWSKVSLLGLLVLASSASAITVGPARGKPVAGRPLEVNIPFTVDEPTDRACASANVHYGNVLVPRMTLDVQGRGLKRNLLVTSRANVNESPVTVNVRVGCGPKAVTRKFSMLANVSAARSPSVTEPAIRPTAASAFAVKSGQKQVAMLTPSEPLFPPPDTEAIPQESNAHKPDPLMAEELRKARMDAATAMAQLEATRKELAAVLDVERRTAQTLISADHQVRGAKSEAARMRLVLQCVAAGLVLVTAGLIWFEVNRVTFRRRTSRQEPEQEPTMLASMEPA